MIKHHSSRDFSEAEFISNSMSQEFMAFALGLSITIWIDFSRPFPTIIFSSAYGRGMTPESY
jgi:hypothetical protein